MQKTERLSEALLVRMTPAQRRDFERAAQRHRMTLSEWCRAALTLVAQSKTLGALVDREGK